jgi:hypothetical protein
MESNQLTRQSCAPPSQVKQGRPAKGFFLFFLALFVVPLAFGGPTKQAFAKADSPATDANRKIWIRLTIEKATVWPVKADGSCWDPCGWSRPTLPQRQLKPYAWYLKKPAFKKMVNGWKAPDVQVQISFGKTSYKTKVATDTTQPRWPVSKILSIDPRSSWRVKVVDKDSWNEEVIGAYSHRALPLAFREGGSFTLRKIGQVESIHFRIERLSPRRAKMAKSAEARKSPSVPKSMSKQTVPRRPTPRPVRRQVAFKKKPPVRNRQAPAAPRKPAIVTPRATPKPPVAKKVAVSKTQPSQPNVRPLFYRVTLLRADIWPVKPSGHCWDWCWSRAKKMPPRGLHSYQSYYLQPTFKSLAKGRWAPEPWVSFAVGNKSWRTRSLPNTTQPSWKKSFLLNGSRTGPVVIRVMDKDTFGSELIGEWKRTAFPASWKKGGVFTLEMFGQVERLKIRVQPVFPRSPGTRVLKAAHTIPPGVRFVKVTVVKARIWPLRKDKSCWDTCARWSVPSLPPRGLRPFDSYMKHQGFKSLAAGHVAPDPRVKIQIGKYDKYITPTKANTLTPIWNATHIFRIRGNAPMTITVSDDDQNVAHDILRTYRSTRELMDRWSEQVIGQVKTDRLPIQMVTGGRVILRDFGQVEYLELKVEPVQVSKQDTTCEGVYRVRIAELGVNQKRADGRPWHAGVGRMSYPSPYITLWLGSQKLETPVAYKRFESVYQTSRIVPIRKQTTVSIDVRDFSVGFRLSFDKQIKVPFLPVRVGIGMKNEPSSQAIGQTAFFSACTLIKRAKHGMVQLKPFGQVSKVVLFFDKLS